VCRKSGVDRAASWPTRFASAILDWAYSCDGAGGSDKLFFVMRIIRSAYRRDWRTRRPRMRDWPASIRQALGPAAARPRLRTIYGYMRDFASAGVWEAIRHHLVVMLREQEGRLEASLALIDRSQKRPDTVGEWGCGVGAGSVGWPAPLEAGHVAPPAAPRPARPRRDRPPRAGSLSGGNPYFILRDRLGAAVFTDGDFADLYPECGQPACAPWRLALVTLLQFREGLSDRCRSAGRPRSGRPCGARRQTPRDGAVHAGLRRGAIGPRQ
jgi:hypothetical protein